MMNRRLRTSVIMVITFVVLGPAAQGRGEIFSAIQDETKKLHALFDDEWQWTLRDYPEFASRIGDPRFNDRLTDMAVPAIEARKSHNAIYSSAFARSIAPA